MKSVISAVGAWVLVLLPVAIAPAQTIEYVIHISVDGLRSDAVTSQSPAQLPNFYRLRTEGAFTDNARCDVDYPKTLQNHTDMLTARGVYGPPGASHDWDVNAWSPGETLQTNKGSYVAGVYDVAHDNGLRTGLYTGKEKFGLFDESWNAVNGAPDTTGPDNGRDKLDRYVLNDNTSALVSTWMSEMNAQPQQYTFLHLSDPDWVGHKYGWMSPEYLAAVRTVDTYLSKAFLFADLHPVMAGKTAIIVTADHGGHDKTHGDIIPEDITIPFMVWGPGIATGEDLYAMNPTSRLDPGEIMPSWTAPVQPIHNADSSNLALMLLGLDAIPGSGINASQDLNVFPSTPGDANYDGQVDEADAAALAAHWGDSGAPWSHGDFNGDRMVGPADAAILAANWTAGGSEASVVPEPSAAVLLLALVVPLLARRRK